MPDAQPGPIDKKKGDMSESFDFVVVGGGSAGAVIASRLSEDPSCRVALIEAGERPPEVSLMPVAPAAMQLNPATDWMYTADPGKAGLGLNGRRVPVPRGKMLGGSSSLNYMMYVRGHPGDFDSWAAGGATGWSYAEVLPYFRKSEDWRPRRSRSIRRRTIPPALFGSPHARRRSRPPANSSRRRWRRASRAVITMDATGVVLLVRFR